MTEANEQRFQLIKWAQKLLSHTEFCQGNLTRLLILLQAMTMDHRRQAMGFYARTRSKKAVSFR
jgi:hypothetical protein